MKIVGYACAATLLTVAAIATFVHAEAENTSYDSRFYLVTTEAFHSGSLAVPASVPSPFRFRVLSPWLAGRLPLPSSEALPLMTYLSLGLTYFVTLLLCAQLGIGTFPAIVGVAAAYASPTHLGLYFNAFMTDAFGLLLITVLILALATNAVWAFGITAMFAPLAREVALFILPVWCLRSWRRGLAIALLAVVVFLAARWMIGPGLPGPIAGTGPEGPEPTMIGALRFFTSYRLQHPDYLALDLRNLLMSWGWVWLSAAVGLTLVRANQAQIVACAGALIVGALATVAVAGDVLRLFGVLFPIMAIGTGQIVDTMIERKQRAWLGFFITLVVLQFFLTAPHLVKWTHVWSGLAPHINILRIGFAGVLVGVFLIRHDVMSGVRQTVSVFRFGSDVKPLDRLR